MTCCSLQEVCLILPDAQGNDNKNHPAALVACKNQSELVNASMAWESACPSCVKLGTLLQYSHVREQEGLPKVLSYPVQYQIRLEQVILLQLPVSHGCCCYFCITFCYSQAIWFLPQQEI